MSSQILVVNCATPGRRSVTCACGKTFTPKYRTNRFCSRLCASAARQWPADMVDTLQRMWPNKSAAVIGRVLGVTPASVIGKANKLKLPPKGPSIKAWREAQQEMRA